MAFLDAMAGEVAGAGMNAIMGNPARMSHEHFMENQTRADWDNERQVGRDNTYLAGVTPGRAAAYNTMQDATYGEDIRRKSEGIKSMASDLGMSPWEITGTGSASSPVQGGPPSQGSNSQQFMAQAVPLQIAKMNNQTQLATTAMQTQTQRYMADQATNKGKLPQEQTQNAYKQGLNLEASTKLLTTQENAARNKNFYDALTTAYNMLPSETVDLGLYKQDVRQGWDKLLHLLPELPDFTSQPGGFEKYSKAVRNLKTGEFDELRNTAIQLGSLIAKATSGASSVVSGASKFLKGLGTKTTKAGPIGSKETQSIIDGLTKSGR